MFRAVPCSSSGGQIVLLQPLVSSLSVQYAGWHVFRRTNCIITASGIVTLCTVCRLAYLQEDKLYYYSLWYRHSLYSMPVGISSGGQIVLLQPLVSSLSVQYAGWHIFRRTNCIITASGIVTLAVGERSYINKMRPAVLLKQ